MLFSRNENFMRNIVAGVWRFAAILAWHRMIGMGITKNVTMVSNLFLVYRSLLGHKDETIVPSSNNTTQKRGVNFKRGLHSGE